MRDNPVWNLTKLRRTAQTTSIQPHLLCESCSLNRASLLQQDCGNLYAVRLNKTRNIFVAAKSQCDS
ncbi:hypothetical protein FOCC_FOCC006757 [Frankliniella occidentalis]|nr:hypothetical protein FOCC_FOCC006757 [Frankliniella occidentalis]